MISRPLLQAILDQYKLRPSGPHGVAHWARVLENGRRLGRSTGANGAVVELFAVLHDACRESDGRDPHHGLRSVDFARSLRGNLIDLPDDDFELLSIACAHHTTGGAPANIDVTIQTCWDSDRLDLGRVGIRPLPRFLCTPQAKSRAIIAWAHERARRKAVPALLAREWQLDTGGTFLR